jgi:hypothetical protein
MNRPRMASPRSAQRAGLWDSTIESVDSLDRLAGSFGALPKNRERWNFTLHLPELSRQECASWEGRLKRYYFACGCMEGSLASLGSLIGYGAYLWLRPGGRAVGWTDGWYALVLLVVSGLAGKVIGLIHSRKQLERTITQLKAEIRKRAASMTARGEVT